MRSGLADPSLFQSGRSNPISLPPRQQRMRKIGGISRGSLLVSLASVCAIHADRQRPTGEVRMPHHGNVCERQGLYRSVLFTVLPKVSAVMIAANLCSCGRKGGYLLSTPQRSDRSSKLLVVLSGSRTEYRGRIDRKVQAVIVR